MKDDQSMTMLGPSVRIVVHTRILNSRDCTIVVYTLAYVRAQYSTVQCLACVCTCA